MKEKERVNNKGKSGFNEVIKDILYKSKAFME